MKTVPKACGIAALLLALFFVRVIYNFSTRGHDQNDEALAWVSAHVLLLRVAAQSAASILQSFIESVQLVAEVTKSDLFRHQLLLSLYFSRLRLSFFVF